MYAAAITHFVRDTAKLLLFLSFISVLCLLALFVAYFYYYIYGSLNPKSAHYLIFLTAYTGVVLFAIPMLVGKYIMRVPYANFGLCMPKLSLANILRIFVAMALVIPCGFYLSKQPVLHAFYSYSGVHTSIFLLIILLVQPAYYFFEEFFIRGFLFLTLWEMIGWHSYWITDIIFVYVHIGKPIPELIISAPISILLCYITLKTRSIFPSAAIHYCFGSLISLLTFFT